MHNGRMLSSQPRRASVTPLVAPLAALVLTVGALGACSGDDADEASSSQSATPGEDTTIDPTAGAEETPYLPVPEGVELTEQGSALEVGDTATVAYQPNQKRRRCPRHHRHRPAQDLLQGVLPGLEARQERQEVAALLRARQGRERR